MGSNLEVNICGRTLSIKYDEENVEYLKELASFVDESMKEISEIYGDKQPRDVIAILACLNIADAFKRELKNTKDGEATLSAFKESIISRSNELIKLIDEVTLKE